MISARVYIEKNGRGIVAKTMVDHQTTLLLTDADDGVAIDRDKLTVMGASGDESWCSAV
jgi:hypothetical protein